MRRWMLLLMLASCATNRGDARFVVTPEIREKTPILLPTEFEPEVLDEDCHARERRRAKMVLGAVARELDLAGFPVVKPLEEGEEPDPDAPNPLLAGTVQVRLKQCAEGLFGDVDFVVATSSAAFVARFGIQDGYFTNIRGLARDLVDQVATSTAVLSASAAVTSTLASSSQM